VTIQEHASDSDDNGGGGGGEEMTMLQKLAQMEKVEQPAGGSEEEVSEYESEDDEGEKVAALEQVPKKKTDYEKCIELGYSPSYLQSLPPSHLR
jgi:hypothetical protein